MVSLDSIAEISSLYLASVAAQAGLSLTWSETPEDTFCRVVAQLWKIEIKPLFIISEKKKNSGKIKLHPMAN